MKNLILVFALGLALTTFAQEKKQQGKDMNKMEQMKKMTPEERQKAHLDKMTKELNLNTKQQAEIKQILADKGARMRDLKAQQDAIRQKMMAEKKDYNAKMKATLTAEQYTKWLEMKEENREMMMEHREQMMMKKGKK